MLSFLTLLASFSGIIFALGLIKKDFLLTTISISLFFVSILSTRKKFSIGVLFFFIVSSINALFTLPFVINTLDFKVLPNAYQVEGIVEDYPDLSKDKYVFYLKTTKINGSVAKLYIKVYSSDSYVERGSHIAFVGEIRSAKANIFNYKDRLFSFPKKIDIYSKNSFFEYLSTLRLKIINNTRKILKSEQGNLLLSSLLGIDTLEEETKFNFQATGTAHIFAISGLHIGTVFIFMSFVLKRFFLSYNFYSLAFTFLFLIFIGLKFSAIRSFIMLATFVISYELGRGRNLLNALLLSVSLILAIYPSAVISLSFYLSCLAIVGIVIGEAFDFKNKVLNLIKTSFFVNIYETPLIAYFFNISSFTSPIINVAVIPYIGILLPIGLIFVVLSLTSHKLAILFSPIVNFLYGVLLNFVKFANLLPFSFIRLSINTLQITFILLILLFFTLLALQIKDKIKLKLMVSILLVAYFSILFAGILGTQFYTASMNSSDLVLIKSKGNSYLFIVDSQSKEEKISPEINLKSFINKSGVNKINALFILKDISIKEGSEINSLKSLRITIENVYALQCVDSEFLSLNFSNYKIIKDQFTIKDRDMFITFSKPRLEIILNNKIMFP